MIASVARGYFRRVASALFNPDWECGTAAGSLYGSADPGSGGVTPAAGGGLNPGGGGGGAAGAESKFCVECGKPMPRAGKFCPECGKPQS